MKREDLKVGEASAPEAEALQELIWKAKAEYELKDTLYGNYESYERELAQDAEDIQLCEQLLEKLKNNGWISVDELPVVSVGGMKEFNVVTRDQLGHQTVESAWYLNQYPLIYEDGESFDGCDKDGLRNETGWYKCLGSINEDVYYRLHTVTHFRPLPPAPEQPK